MRRFLTVLAVCLGVLLLANLVAGLMSPDQWAGEAALARCREGGRQDLKPEAIRSTVSTNFFGKTATVEIDVKDKGRLKTVRVTLRKPVNFLGWQVVDYQEEAPPG
jgi:hypothetical protein